MKFAVLAAFRARAGMIGALQSCLCLYPHKVSRTKTGHASSCPANQILKSAKAAVLEASRRPSAT